MAAAVDRPNPNGARGTILAGGIALVAGALAFLGVFSYLAARFHYPEVLDGAAADVLPALLATGAAGRAAWALYSVLPLIFIPAGVAAFEALRERAAGPARCGMLFAFLAAIAMMLGLMRWPSLHWELALAWSAAGPEQRAVFAALFDGLNRYLGNYLGEFLGELAFSLFFTLSAVGLWRHPRAPRWLAGWGFATGVLGLIGLWRNVSAGSAGSAGSASGAIAAVAEVNNYLLPAWMIGMGVWLMRASRAR